MDMKQVKQDVEKQSYFQQWKQQHQTAYLAHFFITSESEVQVGYYVAQTDTIWTFTPGQELITEDKEIFKEQKTIAELDLSTVHFSLNEAQERALQFQKEKYLGDPISKQIIVLQNREEKTIYNMTLITLTFKMLNLRIDATNGVIIYEKMQPIMDFVQTIEGKKKEGV